MYRLLFEIISEVRIKPIIMNTMSLKSIYSPVWWVILISGISFFVNNCNKEDKVDTQWEFVGDEGFSDTHANSQKLAFSPSGDLYVAYVLTFSGIEVRKFDGKDWIYIGDPGFAPSSTELSFAISLDGVPYVAFHESTGTYPSYKMSVMKFDGTKWLYVGQPNFSPAQAWHLSLAISPTGEPHVSFYDGSITLPKASVMKYDGTQWIYVGDKYISSAEAVPSIDFSLQGDLYVVYTDFALNNKATVKKYEGTNWINVGNPGFSEGESWGVDIEISSSGQPYVAFNNLSDSDTIGISVMKFEENVWKYVGAKRLSEGFHGQGGVLVINDAGEPFIAFQDIYTNESEKSKASVMKFNGTKWEYVGSRGFSPGGSDSYSLAMDPAGRPYLAFREVSDVCYFQTTVMKYAIP